MIKALLFDLDGTLFDSSEANVTAYSEAFKVAGLPFNEAGYRRSFGLRYKEIMEAIAPEATEAQRALIKTQKAKFYKERLGAVRRNEGLLALALDSGQAFKTALVTTASRENVDNLLAYFKIPRDAFSVTVVGEEVDKGKPDPEAYLTAMKKLNVQPQECCIFEDSAVGVAAGEAAGAMVIRVVL
jgi:HAD superfamily hydrolase (TIGR01509 family)